MSARFVRRGTARQFLKLVAEQPKSWNPRYVAWARTLPPDEPMPESNAEFMCFISECKRAFAEAHPKRMLGDNIYADAESQHVFTEFIEARAAAAAE